jgi:hypothetical protein
VTAKRDRVMLMHAGLESERYISPAQY